MRILRSMTVVALGALALAACRRNLDPTIDPDAPTTLVVENQAFPDMTIYAVDGARRVRLGIAGGHAETRFTLPRYLIRSITSLRFQADPIGGRRTPFSDEIQVSPGDEVVLRIPPV